MSRKNKAQMCAVLELTDRKNTASEEIKDSPCTLQKITTKFIGFAIKSFAKHKYIQ
jgi:hypothetical protein